MYTKIIDFAILSSMKTLKQLLKERIVPFELSIALKYLIPRWRQLSMSIISLISVAVIALVVWLILVFFSVTNGLEKNWIDKLISLTAPIRLTPTEQYYNSYYHKIDNVSAASNYTTKSLLEKRHTTNSDPYDPYIDSEMPSYWPEPHKNSSGELIDIVKETFQIFSDKNLKAQEYEVALSNMRLNLIRQTSFGSSSQSFLSQLSYLSSFNDQNPGINKTILPANGDDLSNFLSLLSISSESIQQDQPNVSSTLPKNIFKNYLTTFLNEVNIKSLKTAKSGWKIPKQLYPQNGSIRASGIYSQGRLSRIIVPQNLKRIDALNTLLKNSGYSIIEGTLSFNEKQASFTPQGQKKNPLSQLTQIRLEENITLETNIISSSIKGVTRAADLQFNFNIPIQNLHFKGSAPLGELKIDKADIHPNASLWFTQNSLPQSPHFGEGVLLPKSFRTSGTLLGDRGYLSFYASTTSSVQEQRLPIFVAGFYDPGLMPIGGKLVFVSPETTSTVRSFMEQKESAIGTGINVWFDNVYNAPSIKEQISTELNKAELDRYWKIETFEEYDFSRDFIQQLRSDKTLFLIIAFIIILVACSNIVSMLILLVNDKKREIGILLSMGAPPKSIAWIFGLCGTIMGFLGSLLGTLAAILTLSYLHVLVALLNALQGHDAFNAQYYGKTLPNELSYEALSFVLLATALLSIFSGIIPAIKASRLHPSTILRAE